MKTILTLVILFSTLSPAFSAENNYSIFPGGIRFSVLWPEMTLEGKRAYVMGALSQIREICLVDGGASTSNDKDNLAHVNACMNANYPFGISVQEIVEEMDRLFARPNSKELQQVDAYQQAVDTLMARRPKK